MESEDKLRCEVGRYIVWVKNESTKGIVVDLLNKCNQGTIAQIADELTLTQLDFTRLCFLKQLSEFTGEDLQDFLKLIKLTHCYYSRDLKHFWVDTKSKSLFSEFKFDIENLQRDWNNFKKIKDVVFHDLFVNQLQQF